jgi:hypothetical protein
LFPRVPFAGAETIHVILPEGVTGQSVAVPFTHNGFVEHPSVREPDESEETLIFIPWLLVIFKLYGITPLHQALGEVGCPFTKCLDGLFILTSRAASR